MKQTYVNMKEYEDIVTKVKKFLLLPIEVDVNIEGFYIRNSKIYSGIKYGNGDPDMSEVAIKFYELIYNFDGLSWLKFADKRPIVSEEDIMGDTMNTISRVVPLASKEKGTFFKENYHCLANFWVLPMKVGRKTNEFSKNSPPHGKISKRIEIFKEDTKDFMDRYLKLIQDSIGENERMTSYFNNYLNTFDIKFDDKDWFINFCKKHYLIDSFVSKDGVINFFSLPHKEGLLSENDVNYIIDTMWDLIQRRAQVIAESEFELTNKLYDVFLKNEEL